MCSQSRSCHTAPLVPAPSAEKREVQGKEREGRPVPKGKFVARGGGGRRPGVFLWFKAQENVLVFSQHQLAGFAPFSPLHQS